MAPPGCRFGPGTRFSICRCNFQVFMGQTIASSDAVSVFGTQTWKSEIKFSSLSATIFMSQQLALSRRYLRIAGAEDTYVVHETRSVLHGHRHKADKEKWILWCTVHPRWSIEILGNWMCKYANTRYTTKILFHIINSKDECCQLPVER